LERQSKTISTSNRPDSGFVSGSERSVSSAEDVDKIRFFNSTLLREVNSMKRTIVNDSLSSEEFELILDNCLYAMSKTIVNFYCDYLLLFPSHQVIIGKLQFRQKSTVALPYVASKNF
jgi:hypothetical protein